MTTRALLPGLVALATLATCGDDTAVTDDADAAATCTCPPSEPPLTGRIVRVRADNPLSAGGAGGADAYCPAGAVALGGACEIAIPDTDVVLMSSRFTSGSTSPGYLCSWSTVAETQPQIGTAEVVCLLPTP